MKRHTRKNTHKEKKICKEGKIKNCITKFKFLQIHKTQEKTRTHENYKTEKRKEQEQEEVEKKRERENATLWRKDA